MTGAVEGMRVALVIPTLDEAASIGAVVAEIPRDLIARVIVADASADDRTREAARAAGAEAIHVGRGYGRACLDGALLARDCEIVAFMDGDGADDPAALEDMIAAIRRGDCDFAIGSRTRGVREPDAMAWHQVFAGRVFGLGVRALYGVSYTDMSAQRAIRRDALIALDMRELTYGWNLEMQMLAARDGLRVMELPTPCRRRIGGESKVAGSVRGTLKAGFRIAATFIAVALRPRASARLSQQAAGR